MAQNFEHHRSEQRWSSKFLRIQRGNKKRENVSSLKIERQDEISPESPHFSDSPNSKNEENASQDQTVFTFEINLESVDDFLGSHLNQDRFSAQNIKFTDLEV